MTLPSDILFDPLIADETRSLKQVLLEDYGITYRRLERHGWKTMLIDRDGTEIGAMNLLEAWRLVRDRRAAGEARL